MQKQFKDQIIPDEISNICYGFYFVNKDKFDGINTDSFNYNYLKHYNDYVMFGKNIINRDLHNRYEWKIECNKYCGRMGIIDETNNASQTILKLNRVTDIGRHPNIIACGSNGGRYMGYTFGKRDSSLDNFISGDKDTVTITVDFRANEVIFQSEYGNKEEVKLLSTDINKVRFIASFGYHNSSVKIV